jgi:hypothetical protein
MKWHTETSGLVGMRFLRPLPGLAPLARQRNSDIRGRLKVTDTIEGMERYQQNCANHFERMVKRPLTIGDEGETKTYPGLLIIIYEDVSIIDLLCFK